MILNFIDRHLPLVFAGILVAVAVVGLGLAAFAPTPTPEERAADDQRFADDLMDSVVIVNPKPGVECVVVRGYSASNPRSMSCYAVEAK